MRNEKEQARKKICIGESSTNHMKWQFEKAVESLQTLITPETVAEYGEELTTEFLRDLLLGGDTIRKRMLDAFNVSLAGTVFPVERRQKEQMYTGVLASFDELCRKAKKVVSDFYYIPVDAYKVDGGKVCYDTTIALPLIEETGKTYIDNAQQLEVWEAARGALSALQNLDTLAQKYGMYAINNNNYRTIIDIDIEMSPSMGILKAVRTLRINPFAVQQAHDGGLFSKD